MDTAIWLIRIGLSITMVIYGVHQLIKPEYWYKYIPYWVRAISPIPEKIEIIVHGVLNIILGLWFLSGIFPLAAGIVNLIWWVIIAPMVWKVEWESFFRDITIIAGIGAYIALVL